MLTGRDVHYADTPMLQSHILLLVVSHVKRDTTGLLWITDGIDGDKDYDIRHNHP